MQDLIADIRETLTLGHVNNYLYIVGQKRPYFLPKMVISAFKNNPSTIVEVKFNKVLLFGEIKLDDKQRLIIGPLTTQNLFYDLPFEAFSYLENSENYHKLKQIVDKQANFTPENFGKMLEKIAFFLLKKRLKPKVLTRQEYQEHPFEKDVPSREKLVREFHAAISHGDTNRISELASYPQTYLVSFIHEGKTSTENMRREFYQSVMITSNLAILQGVSLSDIEPIQKKYQRLWENTDLTPINCGHLMLSSIMEITELIKEKKFLISDDPLMKHVYTYVDHNYQRPLSREDIAKALNVSPSYLSTYVKKKTNHTLTYLIHEYKINKAEMLLETDESSIIEISDYLGFSNVTYFNRVFKKMTGQTPSQYRINH